MVLGRFHVHPGAIAAVTGVRGDDTAVLGGFFAYHDAGAALAVKFGLADFLRSNAADKGQQGK